MFSSKRLIGRKYSELTEEDKKVPYEIVEAHNGDAYIRVAVGGEKKTFSPPEIASMVLAKLKAEMCIRDRSSTMAITTIEQAAAALKFEIAGIVQGVGFRPHVYRLACLLYTSRCV